MLANSRFGSLAEANSPPTVVTKRHFLPSLLNPPPSSPLQSSRLPQDTTKPTQLPRPHPSGEPRQRSVFQVFSGESVTSSWKTPSFTFCFPPPDLFRERRQCAGRDCSSSETSLFILAVFGSLTLEDPFVVVCERRYSIIRPLVSRLFKLSYFPLHLPPPLPIGSCFYLLSLMSKTFHLVSALVSPLDIEIADVFTLAAFPLRVRTLLSCFFPWLAFAEFF